MARWEVTSVTMQERQVNRKLSIVHRAEACPSKIEDELPPPILIKEMPLAYLIKEMPYERNVSSASVTNNN